jgi:hypothetical protein
MAGFGGKAHVAMATGRRSSLSRISGVSRSVVRTWGRGLRPAPGGRKSIFHLLLVYRQRDDRGVPDQSAVLRSSSKRISDCEASKLLSVVQIFAVENARAEGLGCGDDGSVPIGEAMLGGENDGLFD